MFGKLMKHEWKATYKIMGLINVLMIAVTVFGMIMLQTSWIKQDEFGYVGSICVGCYYITLITVTVVANIFLIIRFYKNLYSNEGYLMFTLPAKASGLLNAKLLTGTIWYVITSLMCVISVLLLAGTFAEVDAESIRFVLRLIPSDNVGQFIILAVLIALIFIASCVEKLVSYYFCLSLGQLSNKNKIACSVIAFIVLNFSIGMLSNVLGVFFTIGGGAIGIDRLLSSHPFEAAVTIAGIILLLLCIASLIFYVITLKIMKNKLNLE